MGVIYERTSHGLLLRHPPTPSERQNLLTTYYVPHHAALESAVATAVDLHGCCTILDVHSFPSRPLPYIDQAQDRPDICVGTNSFHTPQSLATQLVEGFSRDGFSVAVNRPFAGALTPLRYFSNDQRVKSIMVEVNRGFISMKPQGSKANTSSACKGRLPKCSMQSLKCRHHRDACLLH